MPRPANNSGNLGEGAKACLTPGVRPKSATNWHQKNLDKIAELAGAAQQRRVATASSDRTRSRPGSAASFKSTRPRAPLYPFESPRGAQTAGQAGVARCHFADSPSSPPRDSDASNASTNLGATPDHSMSSTRSYSDAGRVEVEQGVERLILEADSHPPPNAQSASRTYAAREAPPIASERTRPASARTASVRAGSSGGVRSLRSAGSQGSAASGSVRAPRPDYASRELFTAGFSATGMPMTSMRSPRLSRAADRAANAQAIEERSAAPRPRSAATPASHRPGQVPTYIARRKAAMAAEQEGADARRDAPPPGFRIVPLHEKEEAIAGLQREWQATMDRFLRLPVAAPRPEQRVRRQALEARIDEIEQQVALLGAPGGLVIPENATLSVSRPSSAREVGTPRTEVQRVRDLQRGPPIF